MWHCGIAVTSSIHVELCGPRLSPAGIRKVLLRMFPGLIPKKVAMHRYEFSKENIRREHSCRNHAASAAPS